jgi:uncharacterized protein YndB with AHSA1/START domain
MKWILIIVGIIFALVMVIVVIGSLLPREHVATVSARIAASPERVWTTITQPDSFGSWRSDLTRVEILPTTPSGPAWREHGKNGTMTMVMEGAEPPRRMATRIVDETLPFGGRWEFDIAPDGADASRVTITERGWVSNPIFRFVSRFVMGHTASLEAYLRALGKHFGSEPTPTVVASSGAAHGI